MTKPITDLEQRLDAAFKRADKKLATKKAKLSTLGDLKQVSHLAPKIDKAPFYFSYQHLVIMHTACEVWREDLVTDKAPPDMIECITSLICFISIILKRGVSLLPLDVNEFHIIAKALEVYRVFRGDTLHRDDLKDIEVLQSFFMEGRLC